MGHTPFSLLPDLRARALIVGERIIGIGELVKNDALALAAHALGDVARHLHATRSRDQDQLCAERAHRLPALHGLVLWHHQDHAITTHRGRHCERDAGVAAGGLDQGVTRLDLPPRLGLHHHRQRGPVLDRTRRIIAFEFGENDVVTARVDALQAHKRGVTDIVFQRLELHEKARATK